MVCRRVPAVRLGARFSFWPPPPESPILSLMSNALRSDRGGSQRGTAMLAARRIGTVTRSARPIENGRSASSPPSRSRRFVESPLPGRASLGQDAPGLINCSLSRQVRRGLVERLRWTRPIIRRCIVPGALAVALLVPRTGLAASLEEVANLARAGAAELATYLVEHNQPDLAQSPGEWLRWEQARLELYHTRRAWSALSERVERLPADVPAPFRQWAEKLQVDALLEQGKGEEARGLLRRLIWSGSPSPSTPDQLTEWRRLVIRSYLVDRDVGDAQAAMLRYRQDYGDGSDEWRLLQAQVMLSGGAPGEVPGLLENVPGTEARILVLLAQLRIGDKRAEAIAHEARKLTEDTKLSASQRIQAWALAAEAAAVAKDAVGRAQALEHALLQPGAVAQLAGVLPVGADALWDAYLAYGQSAGNHEQLLVGQDQAWFDKAGEFARRYPLRARSMYVVVALQGLDPEMRALAHLQLAQSLTTIEGGDLLLRRLYLESRRFAGLDGVPEPIRHRLVDLALTGSEIELASRLMRGLSTPPAGLERFEWQMRRARVSILAGEPDVGVRLMAALLDETPELESTVLDRLLQVIFDLQTIGRHGEALELFQNLARKSMDDQRRRELLFWMADSYREQGHHELAAHHYLRSATLVDPFSMDRWAQTARYQAARELVSARLFGDAHRLFQGLLNATRDPGRRAVLQREIQQLQLKEQASMPTATAAVTTAGQ